MEQHKSKINRCFISYVELAHCYLTRGNKSCVNCQNKYYLHSKNVSDVKFLLSYPLKWSTCLIFLYNVPISAFVVVNMQWKKIYQQWIFSSHNSDKKCFIQKRFPSLVWFQLVFSISGGKISIYAQWRHLLKNIGLAQYWMGSKIF